MSRHHEIHAGYDGGEPGHKNAGCHRDHMRVCVGGAVRRVKRPASVYAAMDQRPKRQRATCDKNVPAHQVQLRKRDIACADHHRQNKIAEYRWDGWNEKERDDWIFAYTEL